MRADKGTLIPILALLLSFLSTVSAKNIWHVSIFQGPAPPPGKGPPIQASALRDKSFLPAQIAAIVASYVFSVVVIGTVLLFVGRRLRQAAQASPKTLSMEMMKPVNTDVSKAFDPSPISHGASPNSAADMKKFWPSPVKELKGGDGWGSIKKGHRRQPSESQASVVTFDESVIEDDKARNEREMERLYAAVMEEDEKRSRSNSNVNLSGQQQAQRLPELQHLQDIRPPPAPARSETKSPARTLTKSPRASSRPTPLSIHSHNSSRSSLGSVKRHGVRGLPISPPMGSPGLAPDYDDGYGDSEPLTPKYYADPGPAPPTPDDIKLARHRHGQADSDRLSPRDARFPMTSFRKGGSVPQSPTVQTIHEVDSRPQLVSRTSGHSISSKASRNQPRNLPLRDQNEAGSSTQQHPLRSAPLPLRTNHPTSDNAYRPERSPGIKATVLESKAPNKGLRTPGTGVPMTPYSPYMPRTPLTPMTPSRLVTREERRRAKKEEGRRVPTIEDAVEEEADMWGAAYP